MRQAKRLANMTGLPQEVRCDASTGIYTIRTVCDVIKMQAKPTKAIYVAHLTAKSKSRFGQLYYQRHPRMKGVQPLTARLVVYPGESDTFAVPESPPIRHKWYRDKSGRFVSKHSNGKKMLTIR